MPSSLHMLAVMTLPIIHALSRLQDQLWDLFFYLQENDTKFEDDDTSC